MALFTDGYPRASAMLTVPVETLLRVGTFGSYTNYLDRFQPIFDRLRFDLLSRSNFNLANLFLFDRFQFSNKNKLLIQINFSKNEDGLAFRGILSLYY